MEAAITEKITEELRRVIAAADTARAAGTETVHPARPASH
jgi:hypothetical protein